ncbi:DEAD-box ATP-dependent RNA helicase 17-like isoform X2 [Papaver somniferum]|uniref:DEAD-box ATP-dependent RNA helicase 17-like isoform X2 n=1 Tax=Papaver somniferum TaxID=3469 RepID=UPI000E6F91D0|nr:DEAD-box ATP-dependent RNA helicase 17-like isoform X2 [Papaver somniferum]
MAKKGEEEKPKEDDVFASCTFSSLGLQSTLCDELKDKMGYEAPTVVQAKAIPLILSGKHVLVNAATGTGKTIVYLVPLIHHLQMYNPRIDRSHGTMALVLVPTRELCIQVYEILQKLLHRFHWIVPGFVMGGENRSKEKARLRKGISILVATPGRLLDHLKNTSSFVHSNLRWIIFDEADRILELGFGKEIEDILNVLGSKKNGLDDKADGASKLPKFPRQNLLLSATLNEKVNHLANISLENPVLVGLDEKKSSGEMQKPSHKHLGDLISNDDVESEVPTLKSGSDAGYNLPAQLVQTYVKVPCGSRLVVLLSILKNLFQKEPSQKIVVFFSTCDAVDFHYSLLSEFQLSSDTESGTQQKQKFFSDVAARGLDFPKVRCIIQYDSPGDASEYVHRVGRTARLGEKGDALLFLQPVEMDYLRDLEKHGVSLKEYPLLKVLDSFPITAQKPQHVKKFVPLELHPWVLILQRALESFIGAEEKMKQMAKDAFCSWIRAYTAHRGDLKRIFMVKRLHLGHVAKSFGLKDQPSMVGRAFQVQARKNKKDLKHHRGPMRKRKESGKPDRNQSKRRKQ